MSSETLKAYTEINYILSIMPISYREKIPQKLRDKFKEKKDENYIVNIYSEETFNEKSLLKETKAILAMLKYNYWCESEEEKNSLLEMFKENENKYQQQIREKYNPDNIFKNKYIQEEQVIETHTELVEYKEQKWYQKLFIKILRLFKN